MNLLKLKRKLRRPNRERIGMIHQPIEEIASISANLLALRKTEFELKTEGLATVNRHEIYIAIHRAIRGAKKKIVAREKKKLMRRIEKL